MIKEEKLKTASTGSWRSCVAWNILVHPFITPKGTVNLSDSNRHFWECSAPCQSPRNHVGLNTWTTWYSPIIARKTNQQATRHSSYFRSPPSFACRLDVWNWRANKPWKPLTIRRKLEKSNDRGIWTSRQEVQWFVCPLAGLCCLCPILFLMQVFSRGKSHCCKHSDWNLVSWSQWTQMSLNRVEKYHITILLMSK